MRRTVLFLLALGLAGACAGAGAEERSIRLASTTSTEHSGLFGHLLPTFQAKTGIRVDVIAVGTGQAIRLARKGDADVLLVHHRPSEEAFVRAGFGVRRYAVMYNDFIVAGPRLDPARVRGLRDAVEALRRIARAGAVFVSRGDDSGTHKRERGLWRIARIDPTRANGKWYRETGSGMGAALNTASALNAYVLSDRATWIAFRNKGPLRLLVQGDRRLLNQYGVILVNPKRHPHVKARDGQVFIDWLTSATGQRAIARFRVAGQQLFFPNAKR